YLSLVFKASDAVAGAFGIFDTGLLGIISGLVAGVLADYLFKSSTRMMGIALLITAIGTLAVRLLPVGDGMMWPAMILLMVMAFGIFMGKAVLLAPVAELNLPEHVNGSAMAVGSFLAYASIFWANPLTAGIIEKHRGNAYVGYHQIFMITLVVALGGSMCAFALDLMNMRVKKRDRQAVGIHAVGDVATSPAEPSTVSLRR
ncbi:transporter, major facilitator family protein, partial [Cutibacterium acnes PA2]